MFLSVCQRNVLCTFSRSIFFSRWRWIDEWVRIGLNAHINSKNDLLKFTDSNELIDEVVFRLYSYTFRIYTTPAPQIGR